MKNNDALSEFIDSYIASKEKQKQPMNYLLLPFVHYSISLNHKIIYKIINHFSKDKML